jgi:hypothetical protein
MTARARARRRRGQGRVCAVVVDREPRSHGRAPRKADSFSRNMCALTLQACPAPPFPGQVERKGGEMSCIWEGSPVPSRVRVVLPAGTRMGGNNRPRSSSASSSTEVTPSLCGGPVNFSFALARSVFHVPYMDLKRPWRCWA